MSSLATLRRRLLDHRLLLIGQSCPRISHFFFADDSLLFVNSKRQSIPALLNIIDAFSSASGQLINKEKSSFTISSNATDADRQVIHAATGFTFKSLPLKYLGVPLYKGHAKTAFMILWRISITGWQGGSRSYSLSGER